MKKEKQQAEQAPQQEQQAPQQEQQVEGVAIEVTWKDSSSTEGWTSTNSIPFPNFQKAVGYLVANYDSFISIAAAVGANGDKLRNVITIPKEALVEIKWLGYIKTEE